jgi:hypothetical protein
MKTLEIAILIVKLAIASISFFINSIVGWYKQKLNNFWFGFFIFFTLLNVLVLITSIITYLYKPLNVIVEEQINSIYYYPKQVGLNLSNLIITIMSIIIIYKNRKISDKYYKIFNYTNTLNFIFNVLLNGLSFIPK